jgi:hypothetical protein
MTKEEALKLALEALEWTLPLIEDFGNKEQLNKQHKAIASLYEVQAQPAQKTATGIQYAQGIPFFIPPAAQPAQEPDELTIAYMSGLYAGKKKRPWTGLTDEQFTEAARLAESGNYLVAFQRIQQWLKEKNS